MTTLLDSPGYSHLVRPLACAVRRVDRGSPGRMRLPARPQRRRQDHDHALDHGTDAALRRPECFGRARTLRAGRPYQIARAGIGFVPEDRRVFADLTVVENLDVARRASQRPGPWTIEAVFDFFPKLRELAGRRSGFLSGGEQQMLTIGRTLMCNPELLLLDEPSEGLAPLVVESLLQQVSNLKRQGLTILLAEQALAFCLTSGRPGLRAAERCRPFLRTVIRLARRSRATRGTACAWRHPSLEFASINPSHGGTPACHSSTSEF